MPLVSSPAFPMMITTDVHALHRMQHVLRRVVSSAAAQTRRMADKVQLSDAEWEAKLSPVQFKVLRQKGAFRAIISSYLLNADMAFDRIR